jgi:glycoside/pentoside/hexuronide:cation symporter, GPH family
MSIKYPMDHPNLAARIKKRFGSLDHRGWPRPSIAAVLVNPDFDMTTEPAKLSFREKFAYGLGDSAANLIGAMQGTFLLFFYTDVFGISAQSAGAILLWSRVVDAFNDPIVGALADRSSSRWGKYRPWILISAVPLSVALVLCYTTPDLGDVGKVLWAVLTYNLLMMAYAANNIPYCALSGVMTSDTDVRTDLASWRFLCAMAATLIVTTFTLDFVEKFGRGDAAVGFQATAALWGVVAICCLVATFAFTRERVSANPLQRSNVRQDMADLLRNGPWLALFLLATLINIQLAMRGGTTLFYFQYFQQSPPLFPWVSNFGLFNAVGLIVVMIGVILSTPLSRRFGKRKTFQVCLLLATGLMAAFVSVPRDAILSLFVLQVAMQLVFGPTIPLLWSMMADVADYGEWKTGRRSTALAFASIVFGLKLGGGIGGWLGGELLHRAGYQGHGAASEEVLRTISHLISVYPAMALLAGVVVLMFYSIDRTTEQQMERLLAERRKLDASSIASA